MRKQPLLMLVLLGIGAYFAYKWVDGQKVSVHAPSSLATVWPARPAAPGTHAMKAEQKTSGTNVTNRRASAAPAPDLPFPTSTTLKKGSTSTEIRAVYGEPTVNISESRNGRVLERYYYFDRERNRLTVATVEDGALTSAFERPQAEEPKEISSVTR